ncbi:helix-turn-helix domain-containing protein [Collinsella tanakaei]|uniref:helix-turn-helix domain-containing protein n=1 Tax=Collinsella tanakaei TaxID=626935 RepID=UPI00195E8E30|nr:helix-turn-helix transcriptional regulator [Collinsella tanakaei]MBM6867491.1 helix-turn-helix domain-containing protein [Collinsella tanakaei]
MSSRFGEMLLDRRRELGMSIQQVANVIKIRPQIIEFFETGNFASMPPRGYAQGMIASYARYLGLNPREVVNAYFDELYVYERGGSASGSQFTEGATNPVPRSVSTSGRYLLVDPPPSSSRFAQRPPQAGYVSDSSSGHTPMRVADNERRTARLTGQDVPRRTVTPASGSRGSYGDPYGTRSPGETQQMRRPLGVNERRDPGSRSELNRGGRPPRGGSRGPARRPPQGGYGRGRGPQRGRGPASALDQRLLLGGIAVIAILLIIIVFLLVRSCSAPAGQQATPSGSSAITQTDADTSANDDTDTDEDADATDAATDGDAATDQTATDGTATDGNATQQQVPTETKIQVTIDDGKTSWIEVKVDGEYAYDGQTAGPNTLEFIPTQTIEITVDHPADVQVTNNGEKVDWDTRTSGVGRVTINVPQPVVPEGSTDGTDGGAVDAASAEGTDGEVTSTEETTE